MKMFILASTQQILKLLPQDDPDFAKIAKECEQEVIDMFVEAVDQEKEWANYLFKDGSMIGLNAQLLSDYIEWIAHKRMTTIGVKVSLFCSSCKPSSLDTKNGFLEQKYKLLHKKQKSPVM